VWPERLGKFKNLPHRVSNPRPFCLQHSALTTTLPRAPLSLVGKGFLKCTPLSLLRNNSVKTFPRQRRLVGDVILYKGKQETSFFQNILLFLNLSYFRKFARKQIRTRRDESTWAHSNECGRKEVREMCYTVYCKSVALGKLFALCGGRAVSSQLTGSCEQLARTMHGQ
jgi:hypothetical protein